MATRNIVPRANGEGSIGTAAKHWGAGHFDTLPNWQEYLAESTGYGIVSGCEPTISNLTVTVSAGIVHLADGTRKELSATNITLDNADGTNPRIDLVYINADGVVAKVTGTASASPVVPSVPTGGISVCSIRIAAGATTGVLTYAGKSSRGNVIDGVAFGIVDNPALLELIAQTDNIVDMRGATITLTSNIKVGNLRNAIINNNGYYINCNKYQGTIENVTFSGHTSASDVNTPMFIVSNQRIKVIDCHFARADKYGECIKITSDGARNNITYACSFVRCYFAGGNYGIHLVGAHDNVDMVTACHFMDLKFQDVKNTCIYADKMVMEHTFTNLFFEPGANAVCIDTTHMYYCMFTNVVSFNDAGGNVCIRDNDDTERTDASIMSVASFGYGNGFTNVSMEGVMQGNRIFKNCFKNTVITNQEIHKWFKLPVNLLEAVELSSTYYPLSRFKDGYSWTQVNSDALVLKLNDGAKWLQEGDICTIVCVHNGTRTLQYRVGTGSTEFKNGGGVAALENGVRLNYAMFKVTAEMVENIANNTWNVDILVGAIGAGAKMYMPKIAMYRYYVNVLSDEFMRYIQ